MSLSGASYTNQSALGSGFLPVWISHRKTRPAARIVTRGTTPATTASLMYVSSLTSSSSANGKSGWKATVTIGVRDASNNPVPNATVSGAWSNGYNAAGSCVTGASGTCSISTPRLNNSVTSVTYTINTLTHATFTYEPNSTTAITVN